MASQDAYQPFNQQRTTAQDARPMEQQEAVARAWATAHLELIAARNAHEQAEHRHAEAQRNELAAWGDLENVAGRGAVKAAAAEQVARPAFGRG